MASRRSKAGRKPKAGARYKCGRLRPVIDQGNDKSATLCLRFRAFQGGKADQWVRESAIGRAWAVGLLDGYDVDGAALRDAGLGYAERYWRYYPGSAGVANYDQEDRRGRSAFAGFVDRRGEAFQRLERAIADSGSACYEAVQDLVVDYHWFPQDNPAWLDRLINGRLDQAGVQYAGRLPVDGDDDRLRRAVQALMALVR